MTFLVDIKEKIRELYAGFGFILAPVFRFLLAICIFSFLNQRLGYMEVLNSTFIVVILSLICAILPNAGITVIALFLIIGHLFGLNLIVAGCSALILLLVLFLGLRLSDGMSLALILMPVACAFHIPAVVPICVGLIGDTFSAFAVGGGVVIWYLLELIQNRIVPLCAGEDVQNLELVQNVFQGIGQNPEMVVSLIAAMATVILVAFVRRLSVDYAWQLSVIFGGICYAFVMLSGSLLLDLDVNILLVIAGSLGAMLIGIILEFYLFGADYSTSETLTFEDDDYVYYVKAVPKYASALHLPNTEQETGFLRKTEESVEADRKIPEEEPEQPSVVERAEEAESYDFQNPLEESLKELYR